MTLNSTACTFGLSDLELVEVNKSYGPQLRFTFTIIVDLVDGRVLAESTPGLRYIKEKSGEYKVVPPIQRSTTYRVYFSAIFSCDMMKLIEEYLIAEGWREKVGKNNPVGELLKMPKDLSTKLPKGKKYL